MRDAESRAKVTAVDAVGDEPGSRKTSREESQHAHRVIVGVHQIDLPRHHERGETGHTKRPGRVDDSAPRDDDRVETERADRLEECAGRRIAREQRLEPARMAAQPLDQLALGAAEIEPAQEVKDLWHSPRPPPPRTDIRVQMILRAAVCACARSLAESVHATTIDRAFR